MTKPKRRFASKKAAYRAAVQYLSSSAFVPAEHKDEMVEALLEAYWAWKERNFQ